jgi:hypothetical protein
MLGFYDNFPANIHRVEELTLTLSNKLIQHKLIQVFETTNKKIFSFDEIAQPTMPNSTVIFEIGIADGQSFSYIDKEELKKVRAALREDPLRTMDFFLSIRYYKETAKKRTPLRFDYYMARTVFSGNTMEIQIFHERGPRYLSPKDLVSFIVDEVNKTYTRRILKRINHQ